MYGSAQKMQPNMVAPSQQDWLQMMMNRAMAIRMAQMDQQQYEAGLPQNMQWADAQRRAQNAGTDFRNTVMTPEMAKARTSTLAGGLGAGANSFQKAKQNSLRAALSRQQQGVMNDAESAAIQQIAMMRGNTAAGPTSAYGQFTSSYSDPYSQSGYKNQFQPPESGFEKYGGFALNGLRSLGSYNQQHPWLGQQLGNIGHGIGGWLGGMGSKFGGMFGGGAGSAGPEKAFGPNEFSPDRVEL